MNKKKMKKKIKKMKRDLKDQRKMISNLSDAHVKMRDEINSLWNKSYCKHKGE